jgi:hypothetical protein
MPAKRTTKAEKLRKGTLILSREAKRAIPDDPAQELANAQELLEAMRVNLTLALASIRADGLTVTTVVLDTHKNHVVAQRPNPALKVQRDALRTLATLRRQIIILEEEVEEQAKKFAQEHDFDEFN